ncbi:hypothetical protein [Deinococcus sp. Leaf326]|uniref:hypothetical protein n=1 Tax=Deinococcus sp. Leaf326 TaxID=1736338 RepID=UPI0006F310F8|nr:hypothetical protein [Deinococcus sp. Leaf326]KQR15449.1 hypothetical protein ASF71_20490 [Deinococcus sp. Leaf326]
MPLPPRAVLLGEARRFREALLNARPHLSSRLQPFPNGTGTAVTLLLEQHFRSLGLVTHPRFVSVHLHQAPLNHAWLQLGPTHLDLTAGQFNPAHPLYLEATVPPWMQAYPSEPYGVLEDFDDTTRQVLAQDLRHIRDALVRRHSDRRYWPLQAVTRRLADMDLLACQHLLTANSVSRPHARRCPYCPPVLPARNFRAVGDLEALDWFAQFTDEERGALLAHWKKRTAKGPAAEHEPPPHQV